MHKVLVSIGAAALLLTGSVASAQSYYYATASAPATSGCVVISTDLSVGARGAEVSNLQRFLVAQNYPGGGNWMVTGYFGQATVAALRNFQSQHNLPMSGMADSATRTAIAGSCASGSGYNYNPYPVAPTYPAYPTYPTYPTYPSSVVSISSLTMSSATPNTSVTVYGTGFEYGNTIVHIGNTSVAVSSSSGTNSLSFIVPSLPQGAYQIYVTTSRGTSNALPFTITPAYPCGSYYGSSCGGCTNSPYFGYGVLGQNFGSSNCAGGPITLSYLSPQSGAINSSVTVYGTGFSSTGNSVRFGNGVIANLNSIDGSSLTFTVPNQLTGFGTGQVVLGTYGVSVSNATGHTSNIIPFTVTSLGSAGVPSITGIAGPTTLQTGISGTWNVTLNAVDNAYTNVSVNWGDSNQGNVTSTSQQITNTQGIQTLTFSHAYLVAGTYTVTFTSTNALGQTNAASATVVVNGTTSGLTTLSYATPATGRVGTQILLVGGGFSQTDNTVHFGVGGTMHLVSGNGTTMYFTIPSYISQCDVMPGSQCFAAQQVVPGTYQIYVTNQNGSTSAISFTVTS